MAKLPRWRQNLHLQVLMPGQCWTVPCCFKQELRQGLLCCIGTASLLTPGVSTGANKAVALYQLGQVNESMREMRCVQCDGFSSWLLLLGLVHQIQKHS